MLGYNDDNNLQGLQEEGIHDLLFSISRYLAKVTIGTYLLLLTCLLRCPVRIHNRCKPKKLLNFKGNSSL